MKLGILTFHSQLNYGGVLQCWALKTALEGMGHEVIVIDRWQDACQASLRGEWSARGFKARVKNLLRMLGGCGVANAYVRAWRTMRFVKALGLSSYHFVDWKDAPRELGVDLVVVGSDQVWHCGDFNDPSVYLLDGAPDVRAISYAASFGLRTIPDAFIASYQRGLARFAAISCREKEGVDLCRELGFTASHVVDPTLLVNSEIWEQLLTVTHMRVPLRKRLICYFMSVDVNCALPLLSRFAERMDCEVAIMTNVPVLKPFPKSICQLIRNHHNSFPRVRIATGFGPVEFVHAFASATWVLTDSFHAMMFSSIFKKNLRFLKPASKARQMMFARIEEFASDCITGPVFADSVQMALDSLVDGKCVLYDRAKLNKLRQYSRRWLERAIDGQMAENDII